MKFTRTLHDSIVFAALWIFACGGRGTTDPTDLPGAGPSLEVVIAADHGPEDLASLPTDPGGTEDPGAKDAASDHPPADSGSDLAPDLPPVDASPDPVLDLVTDLAPDLVPESVPDSGSDPDPGPDPGPVPEPAPDLALDATNDEAPSDVPCLPDCAGRECGPDGCGGSCGDCNDWTECTADACAPTGICTHVPKDCDDSRPCTVDTCDLATGACRHTPSLDWPVPACVLDADCDDGNPCTTQVCHLSPDGCEAACEVQPILCPPHQACQGGACVAVSWCGDGTCDMNAGEHCGICPADCACGCGRECLGTVCVSVACAGKACGPDGCGGSCGSCPDGWTCSNNACAWSGACDWLDSPAPPDEAPLPAQSPAGAVETTTVNGFTDDYLYDGTHFTKVGTRREWGATIVFFGQDNGQPGTNGTNVIDNNDTGREVQIALYDPDRIVQACAWNATCLSNPGAGCQPPSITWLGWNPVQGGNECNVGSGVESVAATPGLLRAVVRPLFWNPDWQRSDCGNGGCGDPVLKTLRSDVRYTQTLRFLDPLIVELQMTVENLSDLAHAPTAQEFPTLYASFGNGGPDLRVILDSTGTEIPVDTPANDGFFYRNFDSPGGFAALQNASLDYGVGLYYENRMPSWQAWQKKGVFNNVRAVFSFGLPAKGTVRARAYVLLGSLSTIAAKAAWLDSHLPPFGNLETPAPDALAQGASLAVAGWALDNKAVAKVEALVDGKWVGTLAPTVRPDVCLVWPGYAQCPAVGFSGSIPLAGLSPCAHLLEVRATDGDGNARILGRRRVFLGAPPPCTDDTSCSDGDSCTIDTCAPTGCIHATIAPGAGPAEICNGVDDDCDGAVDEGCGATHAVYRFRLTSGGTDHFFSTSADVPANCAAEGIGFELFDDAAEGRVPLYQSYCASCTDHLPTVDPGEGAPSFANPEILGYCTPGQTATTPHALRRLYSSAGSDHFVSTNSAEWEAAQADGYALEGILCWAP